MSIIKKGIKAVGSLISKTVDFVKDHWKEIVIAAAVVFTAGVATVGFAGFSGAMAAAGGGFGGFMSAVGSTMWAGLTAIGGTLGIGSGAQGAAAVAGGAQGATLFSGSHIAAALGSESAKASIAAQQAANAASTAAKVSPLMGGADVVGPAVTQATGAAPGMAAPVSVPGAGGSAALTQAGNEAAGAVAKGGLSPLAQAALITTGGQMLSNYAAAKMQEEDQPKGFWGIDLTGKGQSIGPSEVFGVPQETQQIAYQPPAGPQVQAPMPPVPGLMNAPMWLTPEQQAALYGTPIYGAPAV